MSGHNKWSTIKHKKGAADAKRGKIFSRISKEIIISVQIGGPDTKANAGLRTIIQNARSENMPKDKIDAAIKRGTGEIDDGARFEEVVYEAVGPAGVQFYIECLTDNRNRTAPELRHILSKVNGQLSAVAWNFDRKGVIAIAAEGVDEDDLLEKVLEAGGDDLSREGEEFQVVTEMGDLHTVSGALEEMGVEIQRAKLEMIPKTTQAVAGKDAEQVLKCLDLLDDCDDVQNVFSNFDIDEEELERLSAS